MDPTTEAAPGPAGVAGPGDGDALAELRALLGAGPTAPTETGGTALELVVAAVGGAGLIVALPPELDVGRARVFAGSTAVDVIVPEDQLVLADAWARAQSEPVVSFQVHLRAAPARRATMRAFDVRRELGVHVIVLETDRADAVLRLAGHLEAARHGVGHVRRDALGVFLEVDAAAVELLGWPAPELIGRSTLDLIHPEDADRAIEAWLAMRSGTDTGRVRVRFRGKDGHLVWVEVRNDNRLDDPDEGCVVSELVDISAEMAELQALRDRERQLQRLAAALPVGVAHLRADGAIAYANTPFTALVGEVGDVAGLVAAVAPPDRLSLHDAMERALGGGDVDLEVGIAGGRERRRCQLTFRPLPDDGDGIGGVVVCAADVTDSSRLRDELEHRASHDALSGCLNRAATLAALERALREGGEVTLAYVDIDSFKAVNDALGHAAGDELLRVVAARLRGVTRGGDRLGRMGGDEFVVICPHGVGPFDVDILTDRVRTAVCADVSFAGHRIALSASVGTATSSPVGRDATALLHQADQAMYAAKRAARAARLRPVSSAG